MRSGVLDCLCHDAEQPHFHRHLFRAPQTPPERTTRHAQRQGQPPGKSQEQSLVISVHKAAAPAIFQHTQHARFSQLRLADQTADGERDDPQRYDLRSGCYTSAAKIDQVGAA